jgi:hypothetical protein
MTLTAEYQRELQRTYVKGKSVPELIETARSLLGQIENPDAFLEIRLDAFNMVARSLEASWRKFNAPDVGLPGAAVKGMENYTRRQLLIQQWLDLPDKGHRCGPLCPEHGDERDTSYDRS